MTLPILATPSFLAILGATPSSLDNLALTLSENIKSINIGIFLKDQFIRRICFEFHEKW